MRKTFGGLLGSHLSTLTAIILLLYAFWHFKSARHTLTSPGLARYSRKLLYVAIRAPSHVLTLRLFPQFRASSCPAAIRVRFLLPAIYSPEITSAIRVLGALHAYLYCTVSPSICSSRGIFPIAPIPVSHFIKCSCNFVCLRLLVGMPLRSTSIKSRWSAVSRRILPFWRIVK